MKLRIQGDSLRIRVTKTDLAALQADGRIAATLNIAPHRGFTYALVLTSDAEIEVTFEGSVLSLRLPEALAAAWYGDGEVSVAGVQTLPDGGRLELLVEKDFTCLAPRPGEDQSDYFANPAKSAAKTPIDA